MKLWSYQRSGVKIYGLRSLFFIVLKFSIAILLQSIHADIVQYRKREFHLHTGWEITDSRKGNHRQSLLRKVSSRLNHNNPGA